MTLHLVFCLCVGAVSISMWEYIAVLTRCFLHIYYKCAVHHLAVASKPSSKVSNSSAPSLLSFSECSGL